MKRIVTLSVMIRWVLTAFIVFLAYGDHGAAIGVSIVATIMMEVHWYLWQSSNRTSHWMLDKMKKAIEEIK